MLVMRRREGESILIGDEIEVQIIHVAPSRVKIGITAPKSIPVVTKEATLVRRQNLAAVQGRSVAEWHSMLRGLLPVDGE
jgi:carbon storage regulator